MKIKLYYAPTTCALVSWVLLTEVEAVFETIPISLKKNEHKTLDYLKINPRHKVPTLVVNGEALSENIAINQWIHRAHPHARILPSDPWDELQAISMLSWFSSGIHPYLTRIHNPSMVNNTPKSEANVITCAGIAIEECLGIASNNLSDKPYFFSHFSAVDAHFFWCCRRACQLDIKLEKYGNVFLHYQRILARESVQKFIAFEKSVISSFADN